METKDIIPYLTKLGVLSTHSCQVEGEIYTKLSPILRMLGYVDGTITSSVRNWIGSKNLRKITVGKTECWFTNKSGIDALLQNFKKDLPYNTIGTIYRDLFGIERANNSTENYAYGYTNAQMLEIYELISEKPIRKGEVIQRLKAGKL